MWTRTYEHATSADPAELWRLLADVEGWGAWNAGIADIALDGPLAVGTTFRMTPPGDATLTSTIVALDPPHLISDDTEFEGVSIRVDHRVGGGVITYTITVSGPVPDEVAAEIGAGVSADFPEVMAGLAAAAEAR